MSSSTLRSGNRKCRLEQNKYFSFFQKHTWITFFFREYATWIDYFNCPAHIANCLRMKSYRSMPTHSHLTASARATYLDVNHVTDFQQVSPAQRPLLLICLTQHARECFESSFEWVARSTFACELATGSSKPMSHLNSPFIMGSPEFASPLTETIKNGIEWVELSTKCGWRKLCPQTWHFVTMSLEGAWYLKNLIIHRKGQHSHGKHASKGAAEGRRVTMLAKPTQRTVGGECLTTRIQILSDIWACSYNPWPQDEVYTPLDKSRKRI